MVLWSTLTWDSIAALELNTTVDTHHWKFEASGIYSTRSAYKNFFAGSITFKPWKRLWKSWAPSKCKTFVWLAIRNRCWTADRLQKQGLPHPERCPLCDQDLREYSTHSNILCIRTGILVCCPTATEFSPPSTQQQHCLLC